MNKQQPTPKDYLYKAICADDQVRVYAVRTTQVINECQRRQDLWPIPSAALGRTLTVGAMMGSMLKGEDQVTITVQGGGPLGKIVVDASGHGEVRGYVSEPHIHFPLNEQGKLDVGQAVGQQGYVHVTKHMGMKEPYRGSSQLISGEIGEDFTYYFAQSEQTPSAVAVGVMVDPNHSIKASGGYLIQLLPGAQESFIGELEQRLDRCISVSQMVDQGYSPEDMVSHVFESYGIKALETLPICFSCRCSREKVRNTLLSLGQAEVHSMLTEDGQAEVQCHFCQEKYVFLSDALQQLLHEMDSH